MSSATVYTWWKTREAFLTGDEEGAELEVQFENLMGYAGSRNLTLEELLYLGQFEEAGSENNVDTGHTYDEEGEIDDGIEEYSCFSTFRLDEEELGQAPPSPLIEDIFQSLDKADWWERLKNNS